MVSVREYANGANVLHLNPARIEEYEFLLPPLAHMKNFAQLAENIFSLADSLHLKNANLGRTRDLLLPRLVSGKLDVAELEVVGAAELV